MIKISLIPSLFLLFVAINAPYQAICFSPSNRWSTPKPGLVRVSNQETKMNTSLQSTLGSMIPTTVPDGTKVVKRQHEEDNVLPWKQQESIDRSTFLVKSFLSCLTCTTICGALMVHNVSPSHAATDESVKGTKKDPAFEACLSKCMYTCTKPKGVEQKSRAACLPECKQSCATTKAQLLKGVPLSQ
jgi:hypothetical protein